MKLYEYVYMAFYEIWQNRIRTFLTLIGIIIGIAGVIIIVTVVQGAEVFMMNEIDKVIPLDIITIIPRYNARTNSFIHQFTLEDIDYLKEHNPFISFITANYRVNTDIRYKENIKTGDVIGTLPAYQIVNEIRLERGRFINNWDIEHRKSVVVIGHKFKDIYFPNSDPLGKKVSLHGRSFTIIGVVEKDESSIMNVSGINDGRLFITLPSFEQLFSKKYQLSLTVKTQNASLVPQATTYCNQLLEERYGLTKEGYPKFYIQNMFNNVSEIKNIKMGLTILLVGVTAITLLVAGIGVMNIMLVIVTERKKEIGIRKALGGTRNDILIQFVIESIFLTFLGGLLGLGLAFLGTRLVNQLGSSYGDFALQISSWSIILSLGTTVGVGLFFGIYPAFKASKQDPIIALHTE